MTSISAADLELEAKRCTTSDLIASRPTSIQLLRNPEWVDDGAGGRKRGSGEPLTFPAKDRFFSSASDWERYRVERSGQIVTVGYVLVGEYDDDIQEDDYFYVNNKKFEVIIIREDQKDWQTKGLVAYASVD